MHRSIIALSVISGAVLAQKTDTIEILYPENFGEPYPVATIKSANPQTTAMVIACPSDVEAMNCAFGKGMDYTLISGTSFEATLADEIHTMTMKCSHDTVNNEASCGVFASGFEGAGETTQTFSHSTTSAVQLEEHPYFTATIVKGGEVLVPGSTMSVGSPTASPCATTSTYSTRETLYYPTGTETSKESSVAPSSTPYTTTEKTPESSPYPTGPETPEASIVVPSSTPSSTKPIPESSPYSTGTETPKQNLYPVESPSSKPTNGASSIPAAEYPVSKPSESAPSSPAGYPVEKPTEAVSSSVPASYPVPQPSSSAPASIPSSPSYPIDESASAASIPGEYPAIKPTALASVIPSNYEPEKSSQSVSTLSMHTSYGTASQSIATGTGTGVYFPVITGGSSVTVKGLEPDVPSFTGAAGRVVGAGHVFVGLVVSVLAFGVF